MTARMASTAGRHTRAPARPAWAKLVLLAVVAAALFLAWRYTPLAEVLSARRITAWADSIEGLRWSPLLVIAAYTPAAFILFPRPLITLLAVIAYGPWLGFATALSGVTLASISTYWTGYALPHGTLRRLGGERVERTGKALRGRSFAAALSLSLVPVAPFPLVGMAAGAARIRLWPYLAGTALGMTPGTLAATVFADQLKKALRDASSVNYWVLAAVVLFYAVATLIVRRWLAKVESRA